MGTLLNIVAFIVAVNVLIAQLVLWAFYPGSGLQFGWSVMIGLVAVILVTGTNVLKWWSAMRRGPRA